MQGIGTILNRRKPYDLRFLRLKIIVQQILEASQNIFIHMAASNKLPVIKPNAIIQEQFYIIYNQCLAMLIDSMLQFRLYIMKTIENYFSFLFRQMKRLIRFIRKESIVLHLAYKRSTPYQIRVEQKSPALRLSLIHIYLFYSHRYDGITPIDETMQALVDIVRQGKALYIGLSKYPVDKLLYALNYLHDAGVPCLAYQDRYNMFDRHIEKEHLQICMEKGIGVVAFSPLAQGILSSKYLNGIPADSRAARPEGYLKQSDVTPDKIAKVARLRPIAEQRGQSISQLAIAWILRRKEIGSVIIGARNLDQLKDSLHAVDNLSLIHILSSFGQSSRHKEEFSRNENKAPKKHTMYIPATVLHPAPNLWHSPRHAVDRNTDDTPLL